MNNHRQFDEKINQRKVVQDFLRKLCDLDLLFSLRNQIKYFLAEDPVGEKIENQFISKEELYIALA